MPQDEEFSAPGNRPATSVSRLVALIPGVLLCIVVAGVSAALEAAERRLFAHPYVEALVLAILLGMAVRSFWNPSERWQAGIAFSAKQLLEVAVMLLGASISFAAIAASGVALLGAIAATVVVTLGLSFGISRMLGLSTRLSILIACGNSICGNSAIAAVAPVIGADGDDIASSISFTAILGVMMVLGLPLLIPLSATVGDAIRNSRRSHGLRRPASACRDRAGRAREHADRHAGETDARPDAGADRGRAFAVRPAPAWWRARASQRSASSARALVHPRLSRARRFAFARHRSRDVVGPLTAITSFLTVVSMAALGLGVDVRVLATVGGRVTAAVTLSLLLLLAISIGLVHLFN